MPPFSHASYLSRGFRPRSVRRDTARTPPTAGRPADSPLGTRNGGTGSDLVSQRGERADRRVGRHRPHRCHGNEYVPDGWSGWELSKRADIKTKADDDYQRRTAEPEHLAKNTSTFVFVTPDDGTARRTGPTPKKRRRSGAMFAHTTSPRVRPQRSGWRMAVQEQSNSALSTDEGALLGATAGSAFTNHS